MFTRERVSAPSSFLSRTLGTRIRPSSPSKFNVEVGLVKYYENIFTH